MLALSDPRFDLRPGLAPRFPQLIVLLQVQPEFRGHVEILAKAQSRIRSDGAPAVDDVIDPRRRHIQIPRELVLAEGERVEELFFR